MGNENFDEELKNHIKQVFEDYDDGQANEGWNLLREKYPEKNNRKYFFWWISAAVLLFTILLFWIFQPGTNDLKAVKNRKLTETDFAAIQVKPDQLSKRINSESDSVNVFLAEKSSLRTASKFVVEQNPIQQKTVNINATNTETDQTSKYNHSVFTGIKLDSADQKNDQAQTLDLAKTDSVNQKNIQSIDSSKNPIVKSNIKKEVVKTVSAKKLTKKTARFGLSLYAGPQLNFANNSNTLFGFGAGFSADFKLNEKLKLTTGLGLVQNNLSYQKSTNNNFYASFPANSVTNPSGNTIVNNTTLNNLDASLLQLDVPVNLIYQILPGKNSIAVLAGLSSGTFAKETYQYSYANAANDFRDSKSFQSFYLLKTLNVAAQIGLPIKKYNLQVEPFVKVPLGNTTTQQLKFGAAGINLRFNFEPIKK
ncbi:MAG: hypothetical protein EOP41_02215 [Sphingobacteriaceae bacterium]|nr:MAG: hypothetical protein EOP41_02215 [Sphingobacteriaceae bacterium]